MPKVKTAVDVASLLAESRAAHVQYRAHSAHTTAMGGQIVQIPGDPALARAWLARAAALRKQAHDADPQQTDPAWALDPVPHHDLLTFYAEQLAT